MNRAILNIVLGVILLGLAVAVYISGKKKSTPKPPLTRLNTATVTSIEIDHGHAKPIRLLKQDGHWRLASPVNAAADPYAVSSLLDIATLPCERTLKPQAVKMSDLGLAPPHYRMQFDKTTVKVGGIEPLKLRRYMETDGRICLVRNPTAAGLSGRYVNLVSRHLLSSPHSVISIRLPNFTLNRTGKAHGSWTVSPAQPDATKTAASQLANNWLSAESEWNEAVSKRKHKQRHAQHVQIELEGGKTIDFLIVGRSPQFVLERPSIGIRYELSEEQGKALLSLTKVKPKRRQKPNRIPVEAMKAVAPSSSAR